MYFSFIFDIIQIFQNYRIFYISTKTTNKYKILNKNDFFVAMNDHSLSDIDRDRLYGAMISRQEVFETIIDGKRLFCVVNLHAN